MARMTERRYLELKQLLQKINENLDDAIKEQQRTMAAGDLRENEEYATARARTESLVKQKTDLEEQLANTEIVQEDRSPRIVIGSLIDICKVKSDGTPLGEPRRFTLEESGDTILKKILGVNSSLGKAIINGTDGIYRVAEGGGIYYSVKKVFNNG